MNIGTGGGSVATNTAFGASALAVNTTGANLVAVGTSALAANTTGSDNTAVGSGALASNTTGLNNMAFGRDALRGNLTGASNCAFGYTALRFTTSGNNSAFGNQALFTNTSGGTNTAIGDSALYSNTTASNNVAIGFEAGKANTTGATNVFVGRHSFYSNTTASDNTGVGHEAGYSNTTGTSNTALGQQALRSNTTAVNNTAVGYQAGYSNTTGSPNVFVGFQAGYSNTTSASNTFMGDVAGYSTTGAANTFLGRGAGYFVTSGAKNTILGRYDGNQGSLDIRTSSNYIVLSDGDGNPRFQINSSGGIFAPAVFLTVATAVSGAILGSDDVGLFTLSQSGQKRIIPRKPNDPSGASDNLIDLGDGGSRFRTIFAGTGTINTSDANEKQQVRDLSTAEKAVAVRIKGLIKAYKFNDAVALKGDNARIHIGVLAQEVAEAFEAEGLDAYTYSMFCSDTWYEVNGITIDDENKFVTKDTPDAVAKTRLGVRYDELLAFVIAAM